MSPSVSPFTRRLTGRGAAAWDIHARAVEARERGEDVIVLSIGDPEFDTPPPVVAAAKAALDRGDTHYAEIRGRRSLREAIAASHRRRTGQDVDADHVVVVPGAQCGLFCASLCLGGGGEVVTTDPAYTTYEATIRAPGARLVTVRQRADERFRSDPEALRAAVNDDTRALFVANPNNPTGMTLSREEMRHAAELAERHDFWIVADEVYSDLVFEGEFHHFASLETVRERLVTVSSLSKSHAMTGWRIGWIVAPARVAAHLENLLLAMLYGTPGFVQEAALAALTRCAADASRMRELYRARRDLVLSRLAPCPALRCIEPRAGMFLMADVTATGRTSQEFARALYERAGVSVVAGDAFGAAGEDFVRVSFASPERVLEEGCRRIVEFASSL